MVLIHVVCMTIRSLSVQYFIGPNVIYGHPFSLANLKLMKLNGLFHHPANSVLQYLNLTTWQTSRGPKGFDSTYSYLECNQKAFRSLKLICFRRLTPRHNLQLEGIPLLQISFCFPIFTPRHNFTLWMAIKKKLRTKDERKAWEELDL